MLIIYVYLISSCQFISTLQEAFSLIYGVIYFLSIPSMYMLLTIFAITNLNDVSWGTRELETVATYAKDKQAQGKANRYYHYNHILSNISSKHPFPFRTNIHKIYHFSFETRKFDLQFTTDMLVMRKTNNYYIIAVCTYRLVMISIERSETAQKSALEIQDKMQSKMKFSLRIFFQWSETKKFFGLNFVSD